MTARQCCRVWRVGVDVPAPLWAGEDSGTTLNSGTPVAAGCAARYRPNDVQTCSTGHVQEALCGPPQGTQRYNLVVPSTLSPAGPVPLGAPHRPLGGPTCVPWHGHHRPQQPVGPTMAPSTPHALRRSCTCPGVHLRWCTGPCCSRRRAANAGARPCLWQSRCCSRSGPAWPRARGPAGASCRRPPYTPPCTTGG